MVVVDAEVGVRLRNRVATYRAYRINDAGQVTEVATVFEAPDDATAIAGPRADGQPRSSGDLGKIATGCSGKADSWE
jgi:hypothetical protein